MKDVKKLLAEQAKEVLPDERVKQSIKDRLGYAETEQRYALADGGTAEKRSKKIWIPLVAAALALALCLGILLPVLLNDGKPGAGGGLSGNKFLQIDSAEDFYIYGAASVGSLLAAAQDTETAAYHAESTATAGRAAKALRAQSSAARVAETAFAAQNSGLTDEEAAVAETVNGYMALVESLLSEGGFTSSVTASEREGYANKMTVAYRDIDGNSLGYEMYYNETALPADDDDDDDYFEDETEENYAIEGVLVIEGADYAVRGTRNAESERGESESETEFRVTLGEDRYMYVEQSEEREGEETEQEYTYSILEGRQVIERSAFEYEQEGRETEIKLSLTKDGQTQIFYFEKETERGEEYIRIRVGDKNGSQSYRVSIEKDADGNSHYVYEYAGKRTQMDRFDRYDD